MRNGSKRKPVPPPYILRPARRSFDAMHAALAGTRATASAAGAKVVPALDRLDTELDGRECLTGNGFGVADLTAAALLYPLVPPHTPWRPSRPPRAWAESQQARRERPALGWVADMYRRHRR